MTTDTKGGGAACHFCVSHSVCTEGRLDELLCGILHIQKPPGQKGVLRRRSVCVSICSRLAGDLWRFGCSWIKVPAHTRLTGLFLSIGPAVSSCDDVTSTRHSRGSWTHKQITGSNKEVGRKPYSCFAF